MRSSVVLAALVVAPGLAGCAARAPLRLEMPRAAGSVEPGGSFRVEAMLVNRTSKPVRIARGSALEAIFECRRAQDPPGSLGIGVPTSVTHTVFGGVTDVRPDADDPKFCRMVPPETIVLQPGERLPQSVELEVPAECVAGKGRIEVDFEAQDDGRACPGHWIGRVRTLTLGVEIHTPSPAPTAGQSGGAARRARARHRSAARSR